MTSDEDRKAAKRVAWHAYMATPEGRAKAQARDRARDPLRRQHKHERRKLFHRDRLQALRRTQDRRARALKEGVPFELPTPAEPPIPAVCTMCSEPFVTDDGCLRPTLDRGIPSRGYVPTNVKWICGSCNSIKGRRTLDDARLLLIEGHPHAALLITYLESFQ